jgi:hypothetical protein
MTKQKLTKQERHSYFAKFENLYLLRMNEVKYFCQLLNIFKDVNLEKSVDSDKQIDKG